MLDLKYELMDHPAIRHTADGGGPPYIHRQTKPKTWLPGAALFAPEDAHIKKEDTEHEQSEEE